MGLLTFSDRTNHVCINTETMYPDLFFVYEINDDHCIVNGNVDFHSNWQAIYPQMIGDMPVCYVYHVS